MLSAGGGRVSGGGGGGGGGGSVRRAPALLVLPPGGDSLGLPGHIICMVYRVLTDFFIFLLKTNLTLKLFLIIYQTANLAMASGILAWPVKIVLHNLSFINRLFRHVAIRPLPPPPPPFFFLNRSLTHPCYLLQANLPKVKICLFKWIQIHKLLTVNL